MSSKVVLSVLQKREGRGQKLLQNYYKQVEAKILGTIFSSLKWFVLTYKVQYSFISLSRHFLETSS